MTLRDLALQVVQTLRQAGFEALWAGGCVRDQLLGIEPHDYDVATNARPVQVQKLFRRTLAVGAQFGVIEVLGDQGLHVQVATFRSDGEYHDGRHPDSVQFGTAEADAERRDFTINGLFFDPIRDAVIDYVDGQADLKARRLRAIGQPWLRFQEDKLRLMRGVRFVARFELSIDPMTQKAMKELAPQIVQVSQERITDELKKMLALPRRTEAMRWLHKLNLIRPVFGRWSGSLANHSAWPLVSALPAKCPFAPALTAVLLELNGPEWAQHLHRDELHELAHFLRLSNDLRDELGWLLHHLPWVRHLHLSKPSEWKPLLAHAWAHDLLILAEAWLNRLGEPLDALHFCRDRLQHCSHDDLNPKPLLTGDDLRRLGHKPGPHFKTILEAVRAQQLNGQLHSTVDAIQWLNEWKSGN